MRMPLSREQLTGILHWKFSWSHFSKWHHSVNPQCILYTSMCDVSFHFRCRCCGYGRRGFFLDGFPYDRDAADGTSGVHKRQSQAVSCLNCGTFIPCDTASSNRLDLNSTVPPTRFLPWDYFGGLWHHLGTFHKVMGSLEASFKLVITQTAFRLPPTGPHLGGWAISNLLWLPLFQVLIQLSWLLHLLCKFSLSCSSPLFSFTNL